MSRDHITWSPRRQESRDPNSNHTFLYPCVWSCKLVSERSTAISAEKANTKLVGILIIGSRVLLIGLIVWPRDKPLLWCQKYRASPQRYCQPSRQINCRHVGNESWSLDWLTKAWWLLLIDIECSIESAPCKQNS